MFFLFIFGIFTVVESATIQQVLRNGLCLCVADSDIYARNGPGEEHAVVGVLREKDCFVSNGGLLHISGSTWYEVKEVNQQIAWINGYHLRARNMTDCRGSVISSGGGGTTPSILLPGSNPFPSGDPFLSGTGLCTVGALMYPDGSEIQQNGQKCVCQHGNVVCPGTSGSSGQSVVG